jgi:glutathione S-transferase
MPTVYGVNASPFVRKVRVVLAEKQVAYDLEPIMVGPMMPAEFRKMSPLGKIPAYKDEAGRVLADSSVISAYIERTHPSPALYPADAYDYARALWFEEWADSGLVAVIGAKIFFPKVVAPRFFGRPCDEAAVQKAIDEDLPPLFDYLESQLGSGPFLVGGALSIGDISVLSQFVNLRHAGVAPDAARWPKVAAYVAAGHARPAFKTLIDEESAQFS